jgi:hypothetical protein
MLAETSACVKQNMLALARREAVRRRPARAAGLAGSGHSRRGSWTRSRRWPGAGFPTITFKPAGVLFMGAYFYGAELTFLFRRTLGMTRT